MKTPKVPTFAPFALAISALFSSGVAVGQPQSSVRSFDFKGRFLVSISDADMLPSTYVDGKLGAVDGADALSVIRLDRPNREMRAVEIPVTNSVTGPPASIAVTPDGRYAIVIEARGQRPAKANPMLSDLSNGGAISVVDLADPDRPRVTQRVQGLERPSSVSVNADGTLVAVSYHSGGAGKTTPLAVYRFNGGKLSAPVTPAAPGWTTGDTISHVEWHPKENVLALLNVNKATITLVRVADAGGQISVSRWGNTVGVEKGPFLVRFTPDGRHIVCNSAYVGFDGVDALPSASLRGTVQSVRLASATAPDGSPLHQLASRAATSSIPEGLSVSPDGRYVVTTNLEQSAFALDDPKQGFFSSLSLLRLDSATGVLENAGDFAFDGVLPEAAVFDNSSRFLAVTNYTFFDPARKGGSIDFWRIAGDVFDSKRIVLVKMDFSIPVTRGAHSMVIAR